MFLVCSEYMCKRILEDISLYNTVRPFSLFKSGIFGSGMGVVEEHIIPITINIENQGCIYKDQFEWDLANENNM
jgi:hypothetical protein